MFKNLTHANFRIVFLFVFIALQSCEKENITATKEYPNVDKELWQYFEKFEAEGKARGVDIDLIAKGISGKIEETANSIWVGQCNHNIEEPNHLIINQIYWNGADEMQKEKIVFHELGHCYLNKGHNNETYDDGTCKSIMRAGLGECIDNYNTASRSTYCDELFGM